MFQAFFCHTQKDESRKHDHECHENLHFSKQIPKNEDGECPCDIPECCPSLDGDTILPSVVLTHEATDEDGKIDGGFQIYGGSNQDIWEAQVGDDEGS